MTVERGLRLLAGVMILISVTLAHFVSLNWLWFTAFIGLNLFQSSLTNWCPAMAILKMLGLKPAGSGSCCP